MRPLDGYPQPIGYSKASVFPHAGPSSYVQAIHSSPVHVPVTYGDRVQAVEAGMKYFDYVCGGITDDFLYEVVAIPISRSDVQPGAPTTNYGLIWYHVSTRTQVTGGVDLSGSVVRLFALGPK
jgi:hypothetical protein